MQLISRNTLAGPSRLMSVSRLTPNTSLLIPAYRSHSSSSTSPRPSHAYIPPTVPASSPDPTAPAKDNRATTTSPTNLSAEEKEVIARIVRVDQAGELGANWIYRGQKWGSAMRGDTKTVKDVEEMWESERHHLATMRLVQTQHSVRPTLLYPLWQGAAFGLGAVTALMGREAAMACTEAVETVIGEHYDDQIRSLQPLLKPKSGEAPHPSLPLLAGVLEEFRDDELGHLDTAVEEGAQKAPGHSLLSAVIGAGCRVAIKVCERV